KWINARDFLEQHGISVKRAVLDDLASEQFQGFHPRDSVEQRAAVLAIDQDDDWHLLAVDLNVFGEFAERFGLHPRQQQSCRIRRKGMVEGRCLNFLRRRVDSGCRRHVSKLRLRACWRAQTKKAGLGSNRDRPSYCSPKLSYFKISQKLFSGKTRRSLLGKLRGKASRVWESSLGKLRLFRKASWENFESLGKLARKASTF